jgi:hypothetical protein
MQAAWTREAVERLPELLEEWFRGEDFELQAGNRLAPSSEVDLAVRCGPHTLLLEIKSTDQVASLAAAGARLRRQVTDRDAIPVVLVPYMGPRGRAWARDAGISWADLSGNADIHARGLHVHVDGHPNRYATAGRPSHAFSARYARVSRVLLVDTERWWRQTELAAEAGLPQGTVSKVVHRLSEDDLLVRDGSGAVRARAPNLLLESWVQHHRFTDHVIRRYHAVGRSGPDVLQRLAERLGALDLTWAATGLAAAWQYTAHADFRLTTLYVDRLPTQLEAPDLRPVDRGENVWLVAPRDDGVFYGKRAQGCWCVHPVQVYLDLLGHPERANDAAADLRAKLLTWRSG